MKYGLYARKSSEDSGKQVQSIENQIEVLKAKAERDKLNIAKIYQEAKSAKDPCRREQFSQMIQDLQDGLIDGIICWKLDRLSRNPMDGGTVHHYLLKGVIKEIVTYEKTYYPNDNSIMMSVELGMATEYSQALSKNVKRGHGFKTKKGSYPNKAPIGYINTTERIKGEKDVVPDPERFNLVRSLWDLLLHDNIACPQILKKSHEMGLRTPATRNKPEKKLSINGIYTIFRNPFYYGEFRWSGDIHKGTHQPMITKEEFEEAQAIISGRVRPMGKKHSFAFANLLICGTCGSHIHSEHKDKVRKDGSVNERVYYRCTHRKANTVCNELGIREEELEKQFLDLLQTIEVHDEYFEWSKRWLNDQNEEACVKQESIKTQQRKQIDKIDSELRELTKLRIGNYVDQEIFLSTKDALMADKRQIEDTMKLDTISQDYRIEKTVEVFEFCKEAKNLFENGNIDDKKLVLLLLGTPLRLKDKKLSLELGGAFKSVQEASAAGITKNPMYATLDTRIKPGQTEEERALIINGGGGEELPLASKSFQR